MPTPARSFRIPREGRCCGGSCSLFCSRARVPSSCRSLRGPWRLAALRSRWATTRRRAPSLRLCLRARCVQRLRAAWESRRCSPYLRRPAVHDSLSHTPPPLAPGCAGREALQQDPRQGYRHPLAGTHLLHPALTPTLTPEPQPQRCSQAQTSLQSIAPSLDATHPQVITDFCEDFGVPRAMRGALIKKAKTTGGLLGFLN